MTNTLKKKLPAQLRKLQEVLVRYPNVLDVFLFGSQTGGYATPQSDIDLAVLFEPDPCLEIVGPSSDRG